MKIILLLALAFFLQGCIVVKVPPYVETVNINANLWKSNVGQDNLIDQKTSPETTIPLLRNQQ
jgi:hypothetical protein